MSKIIGFVLKTFHSGFKTSGYCAVQFTEWLLHHKTAYLFKLRQKILLQWLASGIHRNKDIFNVQN